MFDICMRQTLRFKEGSSISKVVALMLERHGTVARSCILLYGTETSPSVTEESSQGGLMPEDTIDRHFS